MIEFRLEQYEENGMVAVVLYSDNKFIKKVAECYEDDYAIMIGSALAKGSGSEFNSDIRVFY